MTVRSKKETDMAVNDPNNPMAPRNEIILWKWMRYSGILLVPLAWGHVLIQDVLVGGHGINLDYVALRWSMVGWRIYDFLLLAFAFAHGINGLRQVLFDYVHNPKHQRTIAWALLAVWLLISAVGAVAIIGGVKPG
jgi:succinate dehydrogenase / fumarate reductase membrane anchor subunit